MLISLMQGGWAVMVAGGAVSGRRLPGGGAPSLRALSPGATCSVIVADALARLAADADRRQAGH